VRDAQLAVKKLGPRMWDFVNQDGNGNHLAVLSSLAAWQRGDSRLSPEEAEAALGTLMKSDSAYWKGDKNAVSKVRLVSEKARAATVRTQHGTHRTEATPPTAERSRLEAQRREAQSHPAFLDKRHAEHKVVMAKYLNATNKPSSPTATWPRREGCLLDAAPSAALPSPCPTRRLGGGDAEPARVPVRGDGYARQACISRRSADGEALPDRKAERWNSAI
jgi:hypothetical protein